MNDATKAALKSGLALILENHGSAILDFTPRIEGIDWDREVLILRAPARNPKATTHEARSRRHWITWEVPIGELAEMPGIAVAKGFPGYPDA